MKYSGSCGAYIGQIGLDEFYCIYSAPAQIASYKSQINKIKKVCIDGTGGVVKAIKKPNGDSKYVFLYQVVMKGEDGILPVFQMISAQHDTISFDYWLKSFVKKTDRIPEEVSCDFSLALLNGICLSFNECRLKTYVTDCYRWINGGILQRKPKCYVRLDIAHLIKSICRKKIFLDKEKMKKDFYIRCMALTTTCDSKSAFEEILKSILIVAISECGGEDEHGRDLVSKKIEAFLFSQIETFTVNSEELSECERETNCLEAGISEEPNEADEIVIKFIE